MLVSGPERGSMETAFAFLKGAALRAEARYGQEARETLARFRGRFVGKNTRSPEETESFHAFSRLVREHLGIPLPVLGCLRGSDRIAQSIVARQPLISRRGIDDNVRQFDHMAEAIMKDEGAGERTCPLDGDPIDVAAAPLPGNIERYARKHTRYPVDWAATLELTSGVTAVRVRDVSESGL